MTPGPSETAAELPKGKGKAKQLEPMGTPAGGGNESPEGGASGGGKHKEGASVQSPVAPTGAGPAGPAGGERGKGQATEEGGKGKGKKGEESPSPSPR